MSRDRLNTRVNSLLHPTVMWFGGMGLWFLHILTNTEMLKGLQRQNAFPPDADNIVIGEAYGFAIALIFAPIFALVLWLLLRKSVAARRHWFAWNAKRSFASLLITIISIVLVWCSAESIIFELKNRFVLNAISSVLWSFYWLALRAVLISRLTNQNKFQSSICTATPVACIEQSASVVGSASNALLPLNTEPNSVICFMGRITESTVASPRKPAQP